MRKFTIHIKPIKFVFLFLIFTAIAMMTLNACSRLQYPVYPASDHYDPATKKFRNLEPQRAPIDNLSGIWGMFNQKPAHPPAPLPEVAPDWALLAQGGKTRFIWFGHSSFMLHMNGQTILVDPVFGERASPMPGTVNRFQPALVSAQTLPPADIVLLSHNHYDHLEETTIKAYAYKSGHFITPLGLGVQLQAWGIAAERITELDWCQQTERAGITYTATPARHDSGRGVFDRFDQLWAGFVLESADERLYYSGDYANGKHFADIAARYLHFDLAFIEDGQYDYRWPDNHLFPEEVADVAK